MSQHDSTILHIFHRLFEHFGPRSWWPAETPFEVVIGAILTQNTAWTNVEQAIENLRAANALTAERVACLTSNALEDLIRPSGFFRQKSARLQELSRHLLSKWDGDLYRLCAGEIEEARQRLLSQKGIGPETADSILLYAAERPSFVVDAYTKRVFTRVGTLSGTEDYETIRDLFMRKLPTDTQLFNEYHALIVELAKSYCRKKTPLCQQCPIVKSCAYAVSQRGGK